jgi:hypothetical protein
MAEVIDISHLKSKVRILDFASSIPFSEKLPSLMKHSTLWRHNALHPKGTVSDVEAFLEKVAKKEQPLEHHFVAIPAAKGATLHVVPIADIPEDLLKVAVSLEQFKKLHKLPEEKE